MARNAHATRPEKSSVTVSHLAKSAVQNMAESRRQPVHPYTTLMQWKLSCSFYILLR